MWRQSQVAVDGGPTGRALGGRLQRNRWLVAIDTCGHALKGGFPAGGGKGLEVLLESCNLERPSFDQTVGVLGGNTGGDMLVQRFVWPVAALGGRGEGGGRKCNSLIWG